MAPVPIACDAPNALRSSCPPPERLASWLEDLLADAELQVVAEEEAAWRTLGVVRVFWPPGFSSDDAPHALWWLELELKPVLPRADLPTIAASIHGAVPVDALDPAGVAVIMEAEMQRLSFRLKEELELQRGGPEDVARIWMEGTREGRMSAVREAARRPLPEMAPLLVVELEDADRELFLAVAGALASLRADAQAPALIASLDLESPDLLVAVLPALARLHHPDVPSFLEVLATGHASPMVRHAALQALPSASGR